VLVVIISCPFFSVKLAVRLTSSDNTVSTFHLYSAMLRWQCKCC